MSVLKPDDFLAAQVRRLRQDSSTDPARGNPASALPPTIHGWKFAEFDDVCRAYQKGVRLWRSAPSASTAVNSARRGATR